MRRAGDQKVQDHQQGRQVCLTNNNPLKSSKSCCFSRYTIELTLLAADEVERILGVRPHLVFNHLKRAKLDPNRDIGQAAQTNRIAEAAYDDFHGFIRRARAAVGRGILFDMHGQCAGYNSTMLGYLVSKEDLNAGNYAADNSSVKALFSRLEGKMTGEEFLAGNMSLGAIFEELGYKAHPSPRQPSPGEEPFYRGGYITRYWGSLSGEDEVDAIQIETPGELKNDVDESVRRRFGKALGQAFAKFYTRYYGEEESVEEDNEDDGDKKEEEKDKAN